MTTYVGDYLVYRWTEESNAQKMVFPAECIDDAFRWAHEDRHYVIKEVSGIDRTGQPITKTLISI